MAVDVKVYSDLDKRSRILKIEMASGNDSFCAVLNDDQLLSYGGAVSNRFYIKHFGKEVKGRVVEGERYGIKKSSGELEIGIKKGYFRSKLYYIRFGSRLTPLIKVEASDWCCILLPELNRIYRGKNVEVGERDWGLLVEKEKSFDKFYVYMLMLDGKECLVYEGSARSFRYIRPYISKVGNVLIVKLDKFEEKIKKYFIQAPEYSYLFAYKERGNFYISFDLENWIAVEAKKMIYKESDHDSGPYCLASSYSYDKGLEEVLRRALDEYYSFRDKMETYRRIAEENLFSCFEKAVRVIYKEIAKDRPDRINEDIRLIKGKLQKAREEISVNLELV